MKLVLFMVMSIDGIVAFDEHTDIREYSSKEDHDFFLRKASACDAAIMGRFSFNPEVSCRRKYILAHSRDGFDMDKDIVFLSGDAEKICERVAADGNETVALLGGPRTNAAFLSDGFVDEIYLTVEPVFLGEGTRLADSSLHGRWRLENFIRLNEEGTFVLHYIKEAAPALKRKDRWSSILQNDTFNAVLSELKLAEKDRMFCKHDITHLMDTARIMHILNLERGMFLPKDIVYAAGLLHDIGRLSEYKDGTSHEKAAAPIAEIILKECGYTEAERDSIIYAIAEHRSRVSDADFKRQELATLLFYADKAGRLCFQCDARGDCNWSEERKNADAVC